MKITLSYEGKNYGIFKSVKSLLKEIRKIMDDDFNYYTFLDQVKEGNRDLKDLDCLIDICENWDFLIEIQT